MNKITLQENKVVKTESSFRVYIHPKFIWNTTAPTMKTHLSDRPSRGSSAHGSQLLRCEVRPCAGTKATLAPRGRCLSTARPLRRSSCGTRGPSRAALAEAWHWPREPPWERAAARDSPVWPALLPQLFLPGGRTSSGAVALQASSPLQAFPLMRFWRIQSLLGGSFIENLAWHGFIESTASSSRCRVTRKTSEIASSLKRTAEKAEVELIDAQNP